MKSKKRRIRKKATLKAKREEERKEERRQKKYKVDLRPAWVKVAEGENATPD